MLARLIDNHVLANLAFLVVLLVGGLTYSQLPREQDPTINFNWIDITTVMPGASAGDIARQITEVLEDAVANVADIRFISSTSREGVSNVLVRFEDISETTFDKRINDLRRELQSKENELPAAAASPRITELTTSNAFPTANLVVTGPADDENLRRQADAVREDLSRIKGVDRVLPLGLHEPELKVLFDPARLEELGLAPVDLAETVSGYYRDVAAGTVQIDRRDWLVRLDGADSDPAYLAGLPVITARGEVALGTLAAVERGREKPESLVRYQGRPAVMLAVTKKADTNLLDLVARLRTYIDERNAFAGQTGVQLVLADDQTEVTRNALAIMQNNALVGLALVLVVTWLFLGTTISVLTCIGIPFILAGTFWLLGALGMTLNVPVLLGVVIALGMLVDDAVVVVEAIFYRLQRGMTTLPATLAALREVFAPVTTSVLTTMAAFLPLMLLPGILGKFMFVVPLVVTTALAISLIEAYWMLPAHIAAARVRFNAESRIHRWRVRLIHAVRIKYTRVLINVLRRPILALTGVLLMFIAATGALAGGWVKMDFFASDTLRIFYINIDMPVGTPLADTLALTQTVEARVRTQLQPEEVRAVVSYSGRAFTETQELFGSRYGQIMISLNPRAPGLREADEVMAAVRPLLTGIVGPERVALQRMSGGPPTSTPINVKVRGEEIAALRAAVTDLKARLALNPAIRDVVDDDSPGPMELKLRVDQDAARRAGLNPALIAQNLALLVDGLIITSLQERGETVEVRVQAQNSALRSLDELLRRSLPLADGGRIPLTELVEQDTQPSEGSIRHYNFRRTITIQADIDRAQTDTVQANNYLREQWAQLQAQYPGVSLDFSGELDDIQESLDAISGLFLFGLGLIYLILGTQFRSYFQPLMILTTVPMAFTGVVLGLLVSNNPLSLYTLYGVVALAGIAVNSAIVLIAAANDRLEQGMSLLHATLYAARRRVVPILITSLTTIAGLFSLATGLAGSSLIWGPVAIAIVWGLGFSTVLTLLMVPLLYRLSMGRAARRLMVGRTAELAVN